MGKVICEKVQFSNRDFSAMNEHTCIYIMQQKDTCDISFSQGKFDIHKEYQLVIKFILKMTMLRKYRYILKT